MTTPEHRDTEEEYFFTPALRGLVQQIVHLAFFGDGLSVVIGAEGAGKTALALEIQNHLEQAHDIAFVPFAADLELADCLEQVSKSLGLMSPTSLTVGEMLMELRHFVQTLAQEKKLVVVVIDDAHFLDDQAIGALVSLVQGNVDANVGLHLILFSERGLDTRIDALEILDVAVYDFSIPNLSPSELATFLSIKDHDGGELPSSEIQKIWAFSKGLPGAALAYQQNRQMESSNEDSVRFKMPRIHLLAIGVLALVLIWSLLFVKDQKEPVSEPPLRQEGSSVANKSKPQSPIDNSSIILESQTSPVSTGSEDVADLNIKAEIEASPSPIADKKADESRHLTGSPLLLDKSENTLDEVGPGAELAEPTVEEGIKEEVEEVTNQPELSPLPSSLNNSERFLLEQNSEYYVLQVLAASNRRSLDTYIKRQPNRDSLKMYRGKREGKSWFVVVQGVYKTRKMALDARNALPDEQAKAGPWPRKLSSIKEEIETYRLN